MIKIQEQQHPFYRILELALPNKEKTNEENSTKSSKIHTNKPAIHNEPRNKNRVLQRVQTLRTIQKENVNGKRKNDTNRILMTRD
jgi:hypothetical protein